MIYPPSIGGVWHLPLVVVNVYIYWWLGCNCADKSRPSLHAELRSVMDNLGSGMNSLVVLFGNDQTLQHDMKRVNQTGHTSYGEADAATYCDRLECTAQRWHHGEEGMGGGRGEMNDHTAFLLLRSDMDVKASFNSKLQRIFQCSE